jgi:hypothetical protein
MNIVEKNFPAAFAAMDAAAASYWAYPGQEWQDGFLRQWAHENGSQELVAALDAWYWEDVPHEAESS